MPRKLRVVEPGENAQKPKKLTVAEAAAQNDHREMLIALKSRIAKTVESSSCSPVALAALSRQLVDFQGTICAGCRWRRGCYYPGCGHS